MNDPVLVTTEYRGVFFGDLLEYNGGGANSQAPRCAKLHCLVSGCAGRVWTCGDRADERVSDRAKSAVNTAGESNFGGRNDSRRRRSVGDRAMELTPEILVSVEAAHPCSESMKRAQRCRRADQIPWADLLWVELTLPQITDAFWGSIKSKEVRNGLPQLSLIGRNGSGDGSGSGSGYGDGDGYGDGSGSGYGDGYGYDS